MRLTIQELDGGFCVVLSDDLNNHYDPMVLTNERTEEQAIKYASYLSKMTGFLFFNLAIDV